MLTIFNTLTREKEALKPIIAGKVKIYICGVTVYDHCHLGHARTYSAMDNVIRYLRYRHYDVITVRNITDIDDKIIKRSLENQETTTALTERFTKAMHDDFDALGLLEPEVEPRATQYIPHMKALIERLINQGFAYVGSSGDVYFDVRKFPHYGCLSHHDIDQLESGARVDVVEAKKDPLDFVLWKLAKPGEPAWESPWGEGRPGWHIECSAMAMDLLGETFDIHAGGRDLIFPHHENEIAQSMAATNKSFAHLWMHTGFLQVDKEKMSKSLGNFITIRDALSQHAPEVLRYFFAASHYRSPLIYTDEVLSQAKQSLTRFYTALRGLNLGAVPQHTAFEADFIKAMDDDFNSPVALSVLFDVTHEIWRLREAGSVDEAAGLGALLKHLGGLFGILQQDPEFYFQASGQVDVAKVEALIAERQEARLNKNWAEADRIRAALLAMNVELDDTAGGKTIWKVN
jgi:cysteinyl-tRNA synthetase